MTDNSKSIDATIERVRAADPISHMHAAPDTEAELRILLANLPTSKPGKTPWRSRRPVLRIGAAGASVAAAVAVAVGLISTAGPVAGSFVSQAQAAEIVNEIRHTLTTYAPGDVIEILTASEETKPGSVPQWSTYDTWQSATAPYNERILSTGNGSPDYERTTTAQGVPQIYDTAQNVVYQPEAALNYDLTPGPSAGTQTLTVPLAQVWVAGYTLSADQQGTTQLTITDADAQALQSGSAAVGYSNAVFVNGQRVIGTDPTILFDRNTAPSTPADWLNGFTTSTAQVKLDGTSAIEVYSADQNMAFWFSAKTMLPIKSVTPANPDGSPPAGDDVVTTYYKSYQVLSGGDAQQQLSIEAAHPSANVVTDPTQYEMELNKLL
jgi:hypothetical protein